MIDANGWFNWATRHPASPAKLWPGTNTLSAVFCHSAVGTYKGTIDVVDDPNSGRSVTGVVDYDGSFTQFYPVSACCWAQGSREWNTAAIGIEFAGGYNGAGHTVDEPITDQMVDTAVRLLRDLAEYKGVGVEFWQRPDSLKEHREVYATACPSGRIRWDDILAGLQPRRGRVFLWGDENAGMELRGKQQFHWNQYIEVDAIGDYAGEFPGQHWHNEGGKWVLVLP